jgi:tetratricopeptide (TPR) repeat protein
MRKIALLFALMLAAIGTVFAQDVTPTPTPAPQSQQQVSGFVGGDIFVRAGLALQNQKYQQAVTDYSLFILLNPTSSEGYFRRAFSFIQLNDYNSALADLSHALDLPSASDELTARMYSLRAAIYIDQKQNDLAMADLNAGIQVDASLPSLYLQRGQLYANQNELDKALDDFNKLVELSPDTPDGYGLRAGVYSQLQRYDEAISDLNQLIILTPDDPAAYSERAQIYIQQKKYEPALADLNQAIKIEPRAGAFYLLRGQVNNQLGNQADAASDYLEWIRRQQTDINTDLVLRPGESQVVQMKEGQIYAMSFRAKAGQKVTITASAHPGEKTDPLLVLLDSEFHPLVADDDGGGNFDSAIKDFPIPTDSEYYVAVSHAGGSSDGPVRILLQIAP